MASIGSNDYGGMDIRGASSDWGGTTAAADAAMITKMTGMQSVAWSTVDPYYMDEKKPEKRTLKMKEELTLCSEKLWN